VGETYSDYDSPHDWFAFLGRQCSAATTDPQFQAAVASGDAKSPAEAVADYKRAGQILMTDAACPALVYQEAVQLVKPWVLGAGGNVLYENYWTSIGIREH